VAVFGNADAEGEVGDAVVAVMGNARLKGKVRDAVVAICGNAEVEGEVGDAVVAILGNIKILPGSNVRGDVVSIGGKVEIADGAHVQGQVVAPLGRIPGLGVFHGLGEWFQVCLFKFRLLAPSATWGWVVAGIYFLLYLLVVLIMPRPVTACANELAQRPATTFLLGMLTKLLIPLVLLVLVATGVGVLVVPFVVVAVFFGATIGKAALLQHLGRQILRMFGVTVPMPLLALLLGGVFLAALYMVPIISLLVYGITGIWAIGAAVTACFGGARRETPAPSAPATGAAASASRPSAPGIVSTPASHFGASAMGDTAGATSTSRQPAESASTSVPDPTESLSLPRAGFWERMAAAFLDIVLVSLLSALLGGLPLGLLVALAYFAGMWTWRGTTVGGIVLNLKVVRHDGRPLDFAACLVRSLAAAFSGIMCFLGFLWIAWDLEKQSWHDKIAGTLVVRQPRGTPLLSL
jgi:uncharacterized RDD family membrane protein YckC